MIIEAFLAAGSLTQTGVSDNQPIPWESNASSSSLRYPIAAPSANGGHVHWRGQSSSSILDQQPRSINAIAMGHAFSRSRVSMDALPADDEAYAADRADRRISHYTITPSSSTASLPAMTDHPPAPLPFPGSIQAASVLGNGGPVGLGLPTFIGHTGRSDWPVVCDIADEAHLSDDDIDGDANEMESYQASHRVPVDAALRSMPGVVGLGDGWAGGPQPKPKRGLFKMRAKRERPQPKEADPLALWSTPVTPTAETSSQATSSAMATPLAAADPNARWWRSRKNLFSSQRALSSPSKQQRLQSPPAAPSSGGKQRGGWGSRLNFGSMVDLGRSPRRESGAATFATPTATGGYVGSSPAADPSTPTQATYSKNASTPKRHSVATFLRKPPPHPLELTHGSNGSTAGAAARSQPVVFSSSSSQPSLQNHRHPLLRQAYARSESHLAGGVQTTGVSPKPAPLIINSAPFVSTASMPMWRQPRVSPTALLEVEEEEEEPEMSPELTDRPVLKRSATFGDDEEPPSQQQQTTRQPQASQKPSLATVEGSLSGSPHETHRTLTATPSMRGSVMTDQQQPPSLLGRIKNTLMGRGKSARSPKFMSSPSIPESPRSVQSEQPLASTPTRASLLPPTRSVGRGLRTRSRLFSRRRNNTEEPVPEFDLQMMENRRKASVASTPAEKRGTYNMSKRVAESMISLSPSNKHDTFGPISASAASPHMGSRGRSGRSSWAAPIPNQLEPDESSESDDRGSQGRRSSRVSLGRFKTQGKNRPPLGTVFPRPPETVNQPPSLHWAFPGSYSTPMLHKFGGSTLSLALDISADPGPHHLADIEESPTRRSTSTSRPMSPTAERERALSATIAALTSRHGQRSNVDLNETDIPVNLQPRHSVSVNVDNLANSSADSLVLTNSNIIDFPLPPSSSSCSGDLSSPDPDAVEHLCTPRDARWPSPPAELYRSKIDPSDMPIITDEEHPARHLRKQPSWSTCKTTGTQLTPLATPTSVTSHNLMTTREDSFSSLLHAAEHPYTDKRASIPASITPQAHTPTQRGIVA